MTTELLLIRHGESEGNVGRSTDPDCALTDNGLGQARALGARLAGHDLSGFTALTSPYARTVHTAAQIALATGLSFDIDERIREWGGTATVRGRLYPQETPDQVVVRLEAFLREHRGRKLLIVSHAAPIALLTQLAWGETPTTQGPFWAGVSNCCFRWLRTTCAP